MGQLLIYLFIKLKLFYSFQLTCSHFTFSSKSSLIHLLLIIDYNLNRYFFFRKKEMIESI